jgi:hypothetical protein
MGQAVGLIGLKSIVLGLGHDGTLNVSQVRGAKVQLALNHGFARCCFELEFRSLFVHRGGDSRGYAMDADKEREIIRLWNRLRLLEREGRPTADVLRKIRRALAEHEREAA